MKRFWIGSLAVLALAPAASLAQAPRTAEETARYQRMAAILESKVMSVDFRDAKLAEVVKFFATVTGVNIVVDPAVYQETPESDLTVSLQVEDLPAKDILDLILKFKKLGRTFRHGVLLVTTLAKSQGEVTMRVYDVRDLAVPLKDFPGPDIELKAGGEMSQAVFTEDNEEPKSIPPEAIVEQIKGSTGGTSWDDNPKCRITIFKGMLIIVQAEQVHKEICALLDSLRRAR